MKLIIGLGNPGKKYEMTRHNIGFRIVDAFGKKMGRESTSCSKYDAMTIEGSFNGEKVLLIKPQSFMNLSGKPIREFTNFYKLQASDDLLIIYDDKDMVFGKIRERNEGSSGGHNGIKSIIAELGTEHFHRLKFGVGHEDQKIPTDAFVLQNFSEEEEQQLPALIDEAVEKIEAWLSK
ncbi:MAG: aminoacyl-tRNA hydrolase [Candidatus Altimarinota bacterium]